jgi:hypothetical protein
MYKGIWSAGKRVEFVSDRMNSVGVISLFRMCMQWMRMKKMIKKGSFYKELEYVFYQFLKYHVNMLLGDFNQ